MLFCLIYEIVYNIIQSKNYYDILQEIKCTKGLVINSVFCWLIYY